MTPHCVYMEVITCPCPYLGAGWDNLCLWKGCPIWVDRPTLSQSVADILARNRHQTTNNHHACSNMIIVSHDIYCAMQISHWGRVTQICLDNLTINGSDNGLAPLRRQTIIWINAAILSIIPEGTYFSETLFKIQKFYFRKPTWKFRLWNGSHFASASMCWIYHRQMYRGEPPIGFFVTDGSAISQQ